MSTEEIKAIVRRWIDEVWSKADQAAMDELYAANFTYHYPGTEATPDLEGFKQTATDWLTPFADIHVTVDDVVTEGDKVAVRWTWRGTHTGEFWGIPPTGNKVAITGMSILHIVGGKIVEEWGEVDNMGLMAQLGVEMG